MVMVMVGLGRWLVGVAEAAREEGAAGAARQQLAAKAAVRPPQQQQRQGMVMGMRPAVRPSGAGVTRSLSGSLQWL